MAANTQLNTASAPIPLSLGGTNANLTASNGGIFYSTGSAGAILAGTATAGQILMSGASAAPTWSTTTYPSSTSVGDILYGSATNVISTLASVVGGILGSNSSAVPTWVANPSANNRALLSVSGTTPAWSTMSYLITIAANSVIGCTTNNAMTSFAASANAVLITNGSSVPSFSTTLPSAVQGNITSTGTIATGVWNGTNIDVAHGGTNASSFTAYAVICGGTTSTGTLQNVSGVGTSGQVLVSNGAGALPTWQTPNFPVVLAILTGDQTISASTITKVTLNSASIDTNSNFNTTTNRFTPTVAGNYLIGYTTEWQTTAAAYNYLTYIYLNGSAIATNSSAGLTFLGSNNYVQTGQTVVTMNGSTDYIELDVQQTSLLSLALRGGASTNTQFYAYRIS